ncbi:MAG: DAK2 domain-containing protein [Lachnospiraceae bacterium]|nr:DAK2 domain-containing protein [Ruminococcus sp.]MCM1274338.1 DAK2 domain-containing protein [Lachnospiraceae bacterium]
MTITGKTLRDAVISGANNIYNHSREVDELNVFPVPDGDTGTNMSMTIKNAVGELKNTSDGAAVGEVAKKAASAMLRGARGNSGVILSLIFRGLSKGLSGKETASAADLSASLKLGVDAAYKSVMKPTEGTILTVAREGYENTVSAAEKNVSAAEFLEKYIEAAKISLEKTPELLPALKKAGVVDAGGMGFIVILEGMLSVISGGAVIENADEVKPAAPAAVAAAEEEVKFGYSAEFSIQRGNSKDVSALRAYLETIGDCVVVVDDEELIKANVHTDHPGKALEEGLKFGELTKVTVENIREQNKSLIKADKAAQSHKKAPVEPTGDTGFVAVAAGAGIEALFKDLGVDNVVRGGQTMNPSTEDILEAVEQTPAHNVFVLPNNKNIIMAAEQAVKLADRNVCVLQTRTIPQGISAMMSYDPDRDFKSNRSAMTEAIDNVASGQITFAVRDSEYDGHKIKQGEILAMDNGKIVFTEKNLTKALIKLTKRLVSSSSSYITVMYGSDVSDEDANEAYEALRARISGDIDVVLVNGGQPVYYYIISVE